MKNRLKNRALSGVKEIIELNDTLVDYLDKHSTISAPVRIIDRFSQRTREAFYSNGILEENNGRVVYTHQSYLDFFIAQKILRELDTGKSIEEWLGKKERQFLVRRIQLQLVLFILKEENHERFEDEVILIIQSGDVRFMLKHLTLAVISELEEVSDTLFTFLIDKLNDPVFKSHIVNTVFLGKAVYMKKLIGKGILSQWLFSEDVTERNNATNMLNAIAHLIPDEVYSLLAPHLLENDEWNSIILQSLPWKAEDDPDEIFQLRFTLLKNGIYTPSTFYGLDKTAERNPERCLKLMDIILTSCNYNTDSDELEEGIKDDFWHDNIDKKVTDIADIIPEQVWDILIPHLERLTATGSYVPYDWDEDKHTGRHSMKITCLKMVKKAAKILVSKNHDDFFQRLKTIESSRSVVLNNLFKECLYLLPEAYADYCITWFIDDVTRFYTQQREGNEWELAARCISKHSSFCSDENFFKLERKIITFYKHEITRQRMKETRKWRLIGSLLFYGKPQHFLLPALDPERRSNDANNIISMLQRRFKGRIWENKRGAGGWVASTLSPNIDKISDKAWVDIVSKPRTYFTSRYRRAIQAGPDTILESSVRMFSITLEQIASLQPLRFCTLAVHFPEKTEYAYITALYRAMSRIKAPEKASEEMKKEWEPAPVDIMVKFTNKLPPVDEINNAHAFCRMIRNRCEEKWPKEILDYIKKSVLIFV